MAQFGQILVSDAANGMIAGRQANAVAKQLLAQAEQQDLGPGCIYHTEFSLGPNQFIAGIFHNDDRSGSTCASAFMERNCHGSAEARTQAAIQAPGHGGRNGHP
jgi:hypothetical protein